MLPAPEDPAAPGALAGFRDATTHPRGGARRSPPLLDTPGQASLENLTSTA